MSHLLHIDPQLQPRNNHYLNNKKEVSQSKWQTQERHRTTKFRLFSIRAQEQTLTRTLSTTTPFKIKSSTDKINIPISLLMLQGIRYQVKLSTNIAKTTA